MQGIRIQMLSKPNRKSGHALAPQSETKVRGIWIINGRKETVYVDVFTRHYKKARRKK